MAYKFNPFTGTLDEKLDTTTEISGNVVLNDNYISNDGGNEGISINDNGEVTFKSSIGLILREGGTDYVDFGHQEIINTFDYSVSAWFKTAAAGMIVNEFLNDDYTATGDDRIGWALEVIDTGKVKWTHMVWDAAPTQLATVISNAVLTDDVWHHVVITADRDGDLKMYIDGNITPDDTETINTVPLQGTINTSNTTVIYGKVIIGIESKNLTDGNFTGSIDEIAIFQDRVLSTADVTAFYNSGSPIDLSAEDKLASYWRFDEGSGDVLDSSGNNYTGCLEGDATYGPGAGGIAVTKLEINSNVINVRKNIALNDNYISNDGGNEGIKITDGGDVTIGGVSGSAVYQDGTETIYNTPTGSIVLDGSNDYIKCGNIDQLGDGSCDKFTVASWTYHTVDGNNGIWGMWDVDGATNKIFLQCASGTVQAHVRNGADHGIVSNDSGLHSLGNWEFWVVVYDGTASGSARLKLYFNGDLLAGDDATYVTEGSGFPATLATMDHNDDEFLIGKQDGIPWHGNIGEVTLWDTALTAPNITTLYDSGHPREPGGINTDNLVGYWKFESADISAGTITNSANAITNTIPGTTYNGTMDDGGSFLGSGSDGGPPFAATTVTSGNPGLTVLRGNLTMNRGQFITNNLSSNKGLSMNSSGAIEIEGSVGTGVTSAGVLTLSTAEPTVRVGTADQLGRIEFKAPKEALGGDALLVGASIHAEAVEDFAADNNSTALVFSTGTTSAPIERLRINQDGAVSMAGTLTVDKNSTSTSEAITKGLDIDYDHTGATGTNQTMIGLDINALSNATTGGTQKLYGAKIYADLRASSGMGTTESYGLYVESIGTQNAAADVTYGGYFKVSGTDDNTGLEINCEDGGNDFKIVSSASAADHFAIRVIGDGETTLTTVENGGGSTAHLNMVADGNFSVDAVGDITLDAYGGDVNILQADLTIPIDKKVIFGNTGEHIAGDDAHLTVTSSGNLNLSTGRYIYFQDGANTEASFDFNGGTHNELKITGSIDVADYVSIKIIDNGATTISTNDNGGTDAHLNLDADGDIYIRPKAGGFIALQENDGTAWTPSSAQDATTKAYVDTADNTQYHFIRVGFYNTGTVLLYFPMPGAEDMREVTSPAFAGERLSFLCPFDGSVETIWARSEYASGSTVIKTYIGTTALEIPSIVGGTAVTVDMHTDDTSYEFDFAGGGSNTFSQGNILMFSVNPTTQLGDCHFMIVLKFDVST